jgi:hypothetical protein
MADEFPHLLDRIRHLMDERMQAPSTPLLAEMEHTLTDGYARALALEGERWRIERRIGELAGSVDGGEQASELRRLTEQLESAEHDLTRLRRILVGLRDRVEHVRRDTAGVGFQS